MKVWVSRSPSGDCIAITQQKPIRKHGSIFSPDGRVADIVKSHDGFKQLFGFTPRKGSIKQMNLSLTEIEK